MQSITKKYLGLDDDLAKLQLGGATEEEFKLAIAQQNYLTLENFLAKNQGELQINIPTWFAELLNIRNLELLVSTNHGNFSYNDYGLKTLTKLNNNFNTNLAESWNDEERCYLLQLYDHSTNLIIAFAAFSIEKDHIYLDGLSSINSMENFANVKFDNKSYKQCYSATGVFVLTGLSIISWQEQKAINFCDESKGFYDQFYRVHHGKEFNECRIAIPHDENSLVTNQDYFKKYFPKLDLGMSEMTKRTNILKKLIFFKTKQNHLNYYKNENKCPEVNYSKANELQDNDLKKSFYLLKRNATDNILAKQKERLINVIRGHISIANQEKVEIILQQASHIPAFLKLIAAKIDLDVFLSLDYKIIDRLLCECVTLTNILNNGVPISKFAGLNEDQVVNQLNELNRAIRWKGY